MSRDLYRRLDQLGLSEGKPSLDPYERINTQETIMSRSKGAERIEERNNEA